MYRSRARAIVGTDRFVEVFVSAPVEVCEQRDEEGLYAKARTGEIEHFSGVTAPYEEPVSPDLKLDTVARSAEACVEQILQMLREREFLS